MAPDELLKPREIQRVGFDELQDTGLIFGASRLQRDSGEMFGGEDTRGSSFHVFRSSFRERFLHKGVARRKKLNRPSCDDDILALHRAPLRTQIFKDCLRSYDG